MLVSLWPRSVVFTGAVVVQLLDRNRKAACPLSPAAERPAPATACHSGDLEWDENVEASAARA
eukprot:3945475-Alexandrium_andersonii.AAC.1